LKRHAPRLDKKDNIKIVCQNKRARFEYEIFEAYEAGMVLQGTEVKSLREGRANLIDSYAEFRLGEVVLVGSHISPYPQGNRENHDPIRPRKLLLNKREIRKLHGKTQEKGLTLIPLKIYFKQGRAKVEVALARGKKLYDKRETLKRRSEERQMEREVRWR
jgi:SsrA-binding protein